MQLRFALSRMCDTIERTHGSHEHATPILRNIIALIPENEIFSLLMAVEAFQKTQFVKPVARHIDLDGYIVTLGEEVARAGKHYAVKHEKRREAYVLGSYVIVLQFMMNYADLSAHLRAAHNGHTYAEVMVIHKLFREC